MENDSKARLEGPEEEKRAAELRRLELAISVFLRWGVVVSAVFLGFGWIAQLLRSGSGLDHFQTYQPLALSRTVSQALAERNAPLLAIIIGLSILVSLPMIRVLLTAVLFIRQRDRVLAAMALMVFSTLILSFYLGIEL